MKISWEKLPIGEICRINGNIVVKIERIKGGNNCRSVSLNNRHYSFRETDEIYPEAEVELIEPVSCGSLKIGNWLMVSPYANPLVKTDVKTNATHVACVDVITGFTVSLDENTMVFSLA